VFQKSFKRIVLLQLIVENVVTCFLKTQCSFCKRSILAKFRRGRRMWMGYEKIAICDQYLVLSRKWYNIWSW